MTIVTSITLTSMKLVMTTTIKIMASLTMKYNPFLTHPQFNPHPYFPLIIINSPFSTNLPPF